MTRKEARRGNSVASTWKTRIGLVAAGVLVLGICVAVRYFQGPGSANAQQVPQRQAGAQPAAGNAAGGAETVAPGGKATAPATAKTVPAVVAIVNGEQISRQELAQECLRRYGQEVLEGIVNKHVIWQACQQRNIVISDQDVEQEIQRISAKFGLSPDRWLTMLQQEREITPQEYRREIIWPTLALRALANQQIQVTDEELGKAYESEYGARVKARVITVGSREKAEQVHAKAVANPAGFGDLAKQYSEDQSASVHGLIPPIRRHVGDPEIERVAFGLQEGQVSPILQIANQYLLLQVEKHLPATYIADQFRADAEARLRDRIVDQKLREAAASLFNKLQEEANVVNVYNDEQLRKQMPGVAATINNQQIPIHQLAEECIARYGEDVLDGEINRKILMQALRRKGVEVEAADIDAEIARAAESYGVVKSDGSPDIEKWLQQVTEQDGATVDLYVRDAVWPSVALTKLVSEEIQITEEDLQMGFQANFGPRVEALAIVINNQRQAQKVWEMARGNPTEEFFGQLAQQYSADPISRENLGRIPPIRRFGGQPLVEEEAFKLRPGEMSGLIAVGENFIILRCLGHTTPVVEAMDAEIRAELEKELYEKKLRSAMTRTFDRLRELAQIDNYLTGTSQSGRSASNTGPNRR